MALFYNRYDNFIEPVTLANDPTGNNRLIFQYQTSGYGTLDLNGWWQLSEAVSVNAGLFNLTDKQYSQWGDVRGLSASNVGLDRYTQPGRYAAVNMVWEI